MTFQCDGRASRDDDSEMEKSIEESSVKIITLNVEFDRVLEGGAGDESVLRSARHVGAVVLRLRCHHQAANGDIAILGILFHN